MFTIQNKRVALAPYLFHVPELKAVVDAYPDDYMNAMCFIHYMTNPDKDTNIYLEIREHEKEGKIYKDFPGKYKVDDPVIKAAIKRMKEDFTDLPEDRIYRTAKMMIETLETSIEELAVKKTLSAKEMADLMRTLKELGALTKVMSDTRAARDAARSTTKKSAVTAAYDQQ